MNHESAENETLIVTKGKSLPYKNGYFCFLLTSFILISIVIYLCNYYDNHQHNRHTYYGSIVKEYGNNQIVNPHLWNTERDGERDDDSEVIKKTWKFDITSDDVMVFLHIQNTGGNVFGRHIAEDLLLDRPCNCDNRRRRCQCFRPNKSNSVWLFSRLTVGWKCGVHPDWTELIHCVDRVMDEIEGDAIKRRYFYISLLRDPVTRFISEYYHFTAQETNGKASRHWCGGTEVTHIPKCNYDTSSDVSFDEFLNCPNNLAINRQTRMLSDLTLIGCYNQSFMPKEERDLVMLTSAKNNLHKMSFFGLTEFPRISQYLFQETFDMMFLDGDTHSLHREKRSLLDDFDSKTIERIKLINHLDMQLYDYAKELMFDRFERLKHQNPKLKDLSVIKVAKDNKEIVNWGESEDQQSNNR